VTVPAMLLFSYSKGLTRRKREHDVAYTCMCQQLQIKTLRTDRLNIEQCDGGGLRTELAAKIRKKLQIRLCDGKVRDGSYCGSDI